MKKIEPYLNISLSILIIILLIFIVKQQLDLYKDTKQKDQMENFATTKFDKNSFDCYVINLARNKIRMNNFLESFRQSDLGTMDLIRFEAVDGKSIEIQKYVTSKAYNEIKEIEDNSYRIKHNQLTRGAVGCYLSHLEIYKQIQNSKKEFGLIFEDDAILASNVYAGLENTLQLIPNDWDILLMGSICLSCENMRTYRNVNAFWGLHGYIINQKGIEAILKYANIPFDKQIDANISKMIQSGLLNVYASNPDFVYTNNTLGSDIQIPIMKKEGIDPFQD